MAFDFPTADQLIQQAKQHAKATKELVEKQTVASGAVVGGPAPNPASPAPQPGPEGV